jgi:predicted heme/steroid binding protein
MNIFGGAENISERLIRVFRKNGKLYVMHNGWPYDLSPSPIVKMSLSPNMSGVDEMLNQASVLKNLPNEFGVRIETDWYRNCDARAEFLEEIFGGWSYEVSGESIKFERRPVWACPYLKMMLGDPPKVMYLSVEPLAG